VETKSPGQPGKYGDLLMTIILTDWPKPAHIKAHLRGVETEKLKKLRCQMYHTMMGSVSESGGGYWIDYNYEKVEEELKFRKAWTENCC
jgi:hypothetical protein